MAVWLQAKLRERGLGCGLGCAPAMSVTHSAAAAAVCGLGRYYTLSFYCAFVVGRPIFDRSRPQGPLHKEEFEHGYYRSSFRPLQCGSLACHRNCSSPGCKRTWWHNDTRRHYSLQHDTQWHEFIQRGTGSVQQFNKSRPSRFEKVRVTTTIESSIDTFA